MKSKKEANKEANMVALNSDGTYFGAWVRKDLRVFPGKEGWVHK